MNKATKALPPPAIVEIAGPLPKAFESLRGESFIEASTSRHATLSLKRARS